MDQALLEAERATRRTLLEPIFSELDNQGRSQVWLARQLGVSRSVVANYRHGWRRMPRELFDRLCQLIGVPPSAVSLEQATPDLLFQSDGTRKRKRRRGDALGHARGPPAA